MFRLRRYRLVLLATVLATLTIYHLTRVRNWEVPTVGEGVEALRKFGFKDVGPATTSRPVPVFTSSTTSPFRAPDPTRLPGILLTSEIASSSTQSAVVDLFPTLPTTSSTQTRSSSQTSTSTQSLPLTSFKSRPIVNDDDRLAVRPPAIEEFGKHGQGRVEVPLHDIQVEKPVWIPQKEHFPVPPESLITLPTGTPKSIPRIQHNFGDEKGSGAAAKNQLRRATIAEAFKHAWSGYSKHAMFHDELSPVTGGVKDPFNGWGATLVDTLDTLWIMGLKEDFAAAVKEVRKIDFKTSLRKDIPLFETVIRYLGGLISAYDVSSGQFPVLLDKAVELAEILMGSFDTPNRMPVTYYYWTPSYASQPHRADTRVVLAELGSLSVEFTRLAQITKESKYYDAIARITNELEALQDNTSLPGLWPTIIDASGCKKPDHSAMEVAHPPSTAPESSVDESETEDTTAAGDNSESMYIRPKDLEAGASTHQIVKRQLDDFSFESVGHSVAADPKAAVVKGAPSSAEKQPPIANPSMQELLEDNLIEVECEPQRLAVPPYSQKEVYSIGGQADSTYEYLPKEYMLLGGLNNQYKTMYEDAMDTVRKKLIFRPMTADARDILSVGSYSIANYQVIIGTNPPSKTTMIYEGTHLTCFAGGMFAIGAKIFDLPGDLEIAEKLTNGCIWAYESTTTGIMPETFQLVPCDSLTNCAWNETKWWEALDPDRKRREEQARLFHKNQEEALEQAEGHQTTQTKSPAPEAPDVFGDVEEKVVPNRFGSRPALKVADKLSKRQVDDSAAFHEKSDDHPITHEMPTKTSMEKTVPNVLPGHHFSFFTPQAALSHEDFVKARIQEERLPPGFTSITSRKYILRPEAIESVFIMYRITGDDYWREQGWKMFTAIQSYTLTALANSAITDVTSAVPVWADTMESFWLAETLKYFYLLYSDPSVISLDEYIL
jgi:mannosyl-oligosaccharide alpha-1,2-mannosidase